MNKLGVTNWYDSSIITALPNAGRQPTHRDYSRPENMSGSWKIVVFSSVKDVEKKGGYTILYPETHFGDIQKNRKQIVLKSGDELIFFSSLLHYGAENKSDSPRIIFSQTYDVKNIDFNCS